MAVVCELVSMTVRWSVVDHSWCSQCGVSIQELVYVVVQHDVGAGRLVV